MRVCVCDSSVAALCAPLVDSQRRKNQLFPQMEMSLLILCMPPCLTKKMTVDL